MESAAQNTQQNLCVVASIPFLPLWSATIFGSSSHPFDLRIPIGTGNRNSIARRTWLKALLPDASPYLFQQGSCARRHHCLALPNDGEAEPDARDAVLHDQASPSAPVTGTITGGSVGPRPDLSRGKRPQPGPKYQKRACRVYSRMRRQRAVRTARPQQAQRPARGLPFFFWIGLPVRHRRQTSRRAGTPNVSADRIRSKYTPSRQRYRGRVTFANKT